MIVKEPIYGSAISIHAHARNILHQMCMHQMFTLDHQRENYSHNHFSRNDDRSARFKRQDTVEYKDMSRLKTFTSHTDYFRKD